MNLLTWLLDLEEENCLPPWKPILLLVVIRLGEDVVTGDGEGKWEEAGTGEGVGFGMVEVICPGVEAGDPFIRIGSSPEKPLYMVIMVVTFFILISILSMIKVSVL